MHGAAGITGGLRAHALRQPRRAQGRPSDPGLSGTFDSLNPLHRQRPRGAADARLRGREPDDARPRRAFTLYGLLAESVETDDARSYVTFRIDPAGAVLRRPAGARRGRAVFLAAVARQGPAQSSRCTTPRSRRPRRSIARTVRFDFGGADDRELPLILGLMPVLPKHAIDPGHLRGDHASTPPLGSGPTASPRSDPAPA